MPRAPVARQRILDAAEARLLSRGPAGLVLDAVADAAGVSKGGLLYHFPSKEALIDGLTARMLEGFDADQEGLHARDPDANGSWSRAYLASTIEADGVPAAGSARLMAGILAGIGGDPARLAAVQERFQAWQSRLENEDEIDPVHATIVRLVSDGLWLGALLGLPQLDKDLSHNVMRALDAMTRD